MRSPLFILLAAFLVALLVAQYAGDSRAKSALSATTGGSDLLLLMTSHDPHLAPALAAADAGDSAPLLTWLNAAPSQTRQALAGVLTRIALQRDGLALDDQTSAVDRAMYRYRLRFTTFLNIPTGDTEIDEKLDNQLAYILVAGTSQPTATDIAVAMRILPRLEKQVARTPSSAVWDTIGCVAYVSGDSAKSKVAFQHAVTLGERELGSAGTKEKPFVAAALELARRRLQVAQETDLRAVEQRTTAETATARPPLPLLATEQLQAPAALPPLPPAAK